MPKTNITITNKNLKDTFLNNTFNILPKKNILKTRIKLGKCNVINFDESTNPIIIIKNGLGNWHLKWCPKTKLWYEIFKNDSLGVTGYKINKLINKCLLKKEEELEPNIIVDKNFHVLKNGSIIILCPINRKNEGEYYEILESFCCDFYDDGILLKVKNHKKNLILDLLFNKYQNNWIHLDSNNNYNRTNKYILKFTKPNLSLLIHATEITL
jgi:hypothetical protein